MLTTNVWIDIKKKTANIFLGHAYMFVTLVLCIRYKYLIPLACDCAAKLVKEAGAEINLYFRSSQNFISNV